MNIQKKSYLYGFLRPYRKIALILFLVIIGTGTVINYYVLDLGGFAGITGCSSKFYKDIALSENYNMDELISKTKQLGYKHQPYGNLLDIVLKDNNGVSISLSLKKPADNPNYINNQSWNLYIITGCRITHYQVRQSVQKIVSDLGLEQDILGKINIINARYYYRSLLDDFPL